ncbi:MAG: AraC family transcriptional regulator [Polaribacter sp.]|uniref:helix-turn-helix domain-containing protein n=1 Tax=Polaribacter sp. TaxID=1920175 RepID=UPI0032676508
MNLKRRITNKKRRDFENCTTFDLTVLKTDFKNIFAKEKFKIEENGFLYSEYIVKPKFGKGSIVEINFNCITISISQFILNSDILQFDKSDENWLQLSFLIEGEKIISLKNQTEDILYESQESYMALIESYKGHNKITGNQPFKEVKIKLSKEFLFQHGLEKGIDFKKITNNNLIIPTTEDLLNILSNLKLNYSREISSKILLEAKVLEILAIQINNYKKIKINQKNIKSDKFLKTLYKVRQFLRNNLDQNYSINHLSREFGLNENVLTTKFKKLFNCTIYQFYLEAKMTKAKELLKITQLPIYEIAEEVGYKNATHFSAAFKRYYNETPNKFRNTL